MILSAGTRLAIDATKIRNIATATNVVGSWLSTPQRIDRESSTRTADLIRIASVRLKTAVFSPMMARFDERSVERVLRDAGIMRHRGKIESAINNARRIDCEPRFEHDKKLSTIVEVSRQYGISRKHLIEIVHHLSQSGYLMTSRGKGGGLKLARPPFRNTNRRCGSGH